MFFYQGTVELYIETFLKIYKIFWAPLYLGSSYSLTPRYKYTRLTQQSNRQLKVYLGAGIKFNALYFIHKQPNRSFTLTKIHLHLNEIIVDTTNLTSNLFLIQKN